jgi:hypothetical protein
VSGWQCGLHRKFRQIGIAYCLACGRDAREIGIPQIPEVEQATRQMYHEIHSSGVAAHAQAAAIGELLAKYHVFRCERDLPQALELLPLLDTDDGPFLMRLVPEASGDLRYTFYGSAIAAAAGFDMTGKTIADFSSPVAKFFRHVYERSSRERRPLFTIHRATHAAAIHTWERLVLPVREEDGRIGFFTYNRPRVFQADLLRTVLDMLPDAIIAVHAQRNEAGQITGATLASAGPGAVSDRRPGRCRGCDVERLRRTFRGIAPIKVVHQGDRQTRKLKHARGSW